MKLPCDPDCYWVDEGKLLAGEYPGAMLQREGRRKLRALIACGVRLFVDLTEEQELVPYETWLWLEAKTAGIDVAYYRHAVKDLNVPTRDGMRAILDRIDTAIDAGQPVYVHCWGGIGRTGTVVCCWLMERGRTADQALMDIALLREGIAQEQIRSPEMEVQRQFVRAWTTSVSPRS